METPLFSIFTPTYNRAHLLSGVYDSLCAQSCRDFEWVVVDDGSADRTEELVRGWIDEKKITIVYEKQPNGGKHRAFNRGVQLARGKIFICIDSDDSYVPDALEQIASYWREVENDPQIAGFSCLTADRQGNIIGTHLPADRFVSSHYDLYYRYGVKGDKGLIYYTDILRKYPFPEFENEKFVTEAVVLNRISRQYKLYCIDRVLCCVAYQQDGLSSAYALLCNRNPEGSALHMNELNCFKQSFFASVINAALYVKYCLLAGKSPKAIWREAINRRWTFPGSFILGWLVFLRDKNKR